ncbi:hypothetical protein AALO_G00259380 [Alosa alosa]|uniref:Uncharacterized protein n=1 Tax=Alosa alosa TaxID=278164 RepID=A0AAV6FUI3_9TELE|nr:hypothetical protein AALO_G00259380 [Alosa alosa]
MAFSLWSHSSPSQQRSYVHSRLPVWATTWPDLSSGVPSKTIVKRQSSKYTPALVYVVELVFPILLIVLLSLSIGIAFHAFKRWRKKRRGTPWLSSYSRLSPQRRVLSV